MKVFKSSDLTHKRAEVFAEAKKNGVIIQERNTNGDVRCEYVILPVIDSDYIERSVEVGNMIYHIDDIRGDL